MPMPVSQRNKIRFVRVAQLDRAFGYGPKGRGFESSHVHVLEVPETPCLSGFPAFFIREKICFMLFYLRIASKFYDI